MHIPINVKSPSNISKWQMGFNSAFKGLTEHIRFQLSHIWFWYRTVAMYAMATMQNSNNTQTELCLLKIQQVSAGRQHRRSNELKWTYRLYFHPFSSLSYDRSKASSKTISPHSVIHSFLLQMRVSSPFLKVIQ
jgi:hypothetical protein